MSDEFFGLRSPHLAKVAGSIGKEHEPAEEASCRAFGYLRGMHEKALALELRLKSGERVWYPYAWLGPWRYNPSVGLLLKFTGDLVTAVLLRGSNLDVALPQSGVNLLDRGLQR